VLASLGALAVGTLLGVRHAFEPDHVAAVTTLVVDARSAWRGAILGAIWGIGHTISLVVLGTLLIATRTVLSAQAGAAFEIGVAVMLIVLGARAVWRALRSDATGTSHAHRHGPADAVHVHGGPRAHVHVAGRTLAWRPFAVGLVHGLAGTGAITAFVFAELPDIASRVGYIALFGLGSVAGMAVATGVAGASLCRIATSERRRSVLAVATGVGSIALGIVWALPELSLF
jgi:ABC-type nickel/cobalt efflux system permease component RcnA